MVLHVVQDCLKKIMLKTILRAYPKTEFEWCALA